MQKLLFESLRRSRIDEAMRLSFLGTLGEKNGRGINGI